MISLEAKKRYQETRKKFHQTKRGHVLNYINKAKLRAKRKNLAFDLDLEYVLSIAPDKCPVFGTEFVWGRYQGGQHRQTPSLDRVVPELGYIKGNVVFISLWANMIKSDATDKELYAVADWLHDKRKEVLENVKPKSVAPISDEDNWDGELHPQHRVILTTGAWQNGNNPDNNQGAVQGEDADHRPQTSDGDSVGHGSEEMGTSKALEGFKNYWNAVTKVGWP
jgi:hypothetical protein